MKKIGVCLCAMGLAATVVQADDLASLSSDVLFDLNIDELVQLQVDGIGSITPTLSRNQPASVTSISNHMIQTSGARSLFELLEIYVPNFHYLRHHWEASHMGMRGIISDRDGKYLLLVNGRVMNEQTHYGALSERDLPMMADIRKIDVIRGPGSVVYGPGAISMVINIQTENFSNSLNDQVAFKTGLIDNFQSLEVKKRIALSANRGFYLYAGIAKQQGADKEDAPVVYGLSDTTSSGHAMQSGEASLEAHPNDHANHRDLPKLKLHANYHSEEWDTWLRYTRGGEELVWSHKPLLNTPNGFNQAGSAAPELATQSVGYQQLTFSSDYKQVISDKFWLTHRISMDIFDFERVLFDNLPDGKPIENHREDEYQLQTVANWQLSSAHALAAGVNYSYQKWGVKSPGYPDYQPVSFVMTSMPSWHTDNVGLMLEHQWQLTSSTTQFLGVRVDKDEYTEHFWSPRWALVNHFSDQTTLKAIVSRSLRKNFAEELRQQHLAGETSEPEKIDSYELIWQQKLSPAWDYQLSAFQNNIEIIGIDSKSLRSELIAKQSVAGLEFELNYQTADWQVGFSHSYTKQQDFEQQPGKSQKISAASNGYGNDIADWSNHISKLYAQFQYDSQLSLNGSLRVFWGYPGSEDFIQLTNDKRAASTDGNSSSTALTDPGYDKSVGSSVFLNLGANWQLDLRSSVSLHGYNLLGLMDKDWNKRNFIINEGNFRSDAVGVALNYQYNF